MALPTGDYRAVLLWAEVSRSGRSYDLHFTLQNGERGRATVFFKDMPRVFTGNLKMGEGGRWSLADSLMPLVTLSLEFNPKHPNNNRATKAQRTGELVGCDINTSRQDLTYAEF